MAWQKTEAIIVVTVLLIIGLTFFKPSITGFLSAKTTHQPLDLIITSSQIYEFEVNETLPISSIGISGSVTGNGTVNIWLADEGGRLLVWSNAFQTKPGGLSITGMFAGDMVRQLPSETLNDLRTKVFVNECIETCMLPPNFQQKKKFKLVFELDQGMVLKVDEVILLMVE
jgi:hypothetical protein